MFAISTWRRRSRPPDFRFRVPSGNPIKPWDRADALLDRAFIRADNRALAREDPKLLHDQHVGRRNELREPGFPVPNPPDQVRARLTLTREVSRAFR